MNDETSNKEDGLPNHGEDVSNDVNRDISYLYPPNYKVFILGQYVTVGTAIILLGFTGFNLLIEFSGWIFGEGNTIDISVHYTNVAGIFGLFIVAFLIHRHKESIRHAVDQLSPLRLDEPVWIETGVRDTTGAIVTCRFEADLTLWFVNDKAAKEAEIIQGNIRNALKLFLEEASQDPVLRRSTTYFDEWLNGAFLLPGLAKIRTKTIQFSPISNSSDE
jgi:hypothetical protein